MIIEAQIATLADNVSQLTAKVDQLGSVQGTRAPSSAAAPVSLEAITRLIKDQIRLGFEGINKRIDDLIAASAEANKDKLV